MATLDVLSLAEALEALRGVRGVTRDADIEGYVAAVSQRLDDLCGPIVVRPVTETHGQAAGSSYLVLRSVPSSTTVTVTERRSFDAAPTSVAAADLHVDTDTGVLLSRTGFYGPVTVTYQAGRFADTASVGPLFKLAARIFLQHLWRRQEGGGSVTFGSPDGAGFVATFAVPNAVAEILGRELREPVIA